MRRPLRSLAVLLFALAVSVQPGSAQRGGFTLDQIMSNPFPENLIAAPSGARVAWTFNERGVRNIYVADAPDFEPRKITPYGQDDGQELTNLSFSDDGRTIVYVRGGDHGANWPAEGNLQPDPDSSPVQPKLQVWAVSVDGAAPKLIADGDNPAIAPKTHRVAFERDRRIWITPLDGSHPTESPFVKGTSESAVWSPDGQTLAFVTNRGDHSFIALFSDMEHPIRYIAPTTSFDSMPEWSPDGSRILFVRQPGRGGVPTLEPRPRPWALWVGDPAALTAREVWKSGTERTDSYPGIADEMDPQWGAGNRIVFMSYADGWPHLYSVPAAGGRAALLTPGNFLVEEARMSNDRRFVVYSANAGTDRLDADRRHVYKVPVDRAAPVAMTSGANLDWTPAVTSDGRYLAYIDATAQQPPLPAVQPFDGGSTKRVATDRVPADFPASELVTPEQIVFKSSDGLEVHGQLFKSSSGSTRRPALVYVHGGPPRQMLLGWHYMGYYANDYGTNQYLASRGFVVLSINYRLGIGYGYSFHEPEKAGSRGASEYLDVLAGAKYLQSRPDVDPARIGIWGGSYGGYLTALALARNSDVFATGVDIHGVHNWLTQGRGTPNITAAWEGDGITEQDLQEQARVAYESSPISAVKSWKSPVLLIQADDDRNVDFHQTVDLKQRLLAQHVDVDELVIPDDIHDFLRWHTWRTVAGAASDYLERKLLPPADGGNR
jgi:dipeptidyl aminopeptidase/acylaminoacyl peptidase